MCKTVKYTLNLLPAMEVLNNQAIQLHCHKECKLWLQGQILAKSHKIKHSLLQ